MNKKIKVIIGTIIALLVIAMVLIITKIYFIDENKKIDEGHDIGLPEFDIGSYENLLDNNNSKSDYNANEEYTDLMNVIRKNGCYLDFIYDRLYDMGFSEIRENKYVDLLNAYMKAKNENQYRDPVQSLNGGQQRLLNKILDKYEELSEQYLLEFGVLLGDKNIVLEATSSVRRS